MSTHQGRSWTLRLTANELRALNTYLASTLNDPDTLDSGGFTAQEKRGIHSAAEQVETLHARLVEQCATPAR